MKRVGGLFDKWCNIENFYGALKDVQSGKTEHPSFIEFKSNASFEIEQLINEIKSGCYRTMPYRNFPVSTPKQRTISAPHLRDRLVQHAMMRVIGNIIDRRFIHHSYACRKNRGTTNCSLQLVEYLKKFNDENWFLKIDISKFFYSIPKHRLLKKYENIIKCKNTIKILKEFIFRNDFFNQGEMQVYIDDSLVGICIGNYTAQIGANLTLNSTDHFIKRTLKCKYYLRYMDDMIILDSNKDKLNYIFSEVTKFLNIEELKVNPKSGIGKLKQGVDFVGFRTWKNKRLIRKQSLFRIRRALKKGFNHNQVCSFLAHAKDTNSLNYIKNIIDKYKESSNVNS